MIILLLLLLLLDIYVTSAEKTEPAKRLPYHWVLEALSSEIKQPLLAVHFYLILTLRMHGFLPLFQFRDV
jgi:hypothetical protein